MGLLPMRIELGILVFFGYINLYMTRVNVSVITVAMVKRNVTISNSEDGQQKCVRDMNESK